MALTYSERRAVLVRLLLTLTALPLVLLACSSDKATSLADAVPLDEDRPTFVMFYTDS